MEIGKRKFLILQNLINMRDQLIIINLFSLPCHLNRKKVLNA